MEHHRQQGRPLNSAQLPHTLTAQSAIRVPNPIGGSRLRIIDAQSVKGADTVGAATARVRRGQEDQRPQAAHRGRHDGAAGRW